MGKIETRVEKVFTLITFLAIFPSLSFVAFADAKLFVSTLDATNITQTSATLHGAGGFDLSYPEGCSSSLGFNPTTGAACGSGVETSMPAFPITGYFRYSTRPIAPVYCNDIYGTNMIATGDYRLNTLSAGANRENFAQSITNLRPNTTYYYCAIVSNRDNISYGGTSIVKEFHTNCDDTTIETKGATNIKSSSARLNASFCSTKPVKTYFKYRMAPVPGEEAPSWIKTGEVSHNPGGKSNVYGNISFNLSGLSANKKYEFRAVAETSTENPESFVENFTTLPSPTTATPLPLCPYGKIYDSVSKTCIVPPPPTCTSPQVYSPWTNTCVTPISCTLPQIYFPPRNGCVTPPTCTPPQVYSPWTNTCVSSPDNFCQINPRDPLCSEDSDWERDGNSWKRKSRPYIPGTMGGTGGILSLGQMATPPSDAVVRYHEGIETVFTRQIMSNAEFARLYGYRAGTSIKTFAEDLAHLFAKMFGYVDEAGREIRVSPPDVAAYQLQISNNKLTVYEYYAGKIVDIRNTTTLFKNASGYEYYFKK